MQVMVFVLLPVIVILLLKIVWAQHDAAKDAEGRHRAVMTALSMLLPRSK